MRKFLKFTKAVKYLKRDRKLEAGYMTMEEYIHQEAERRAKLMAETMAEADGRVDGRVNGKVDGGVDGRVNGSIKSTRASFSCTAGRSWNTSGSNKRAHCKGTE